MLTIVVISDHCLHLDNLESLSLSKLLQSCGAIANEVVPTVRVPVVHLNPDDDEDDDANDDGYDDEDADNDDDDEVAMYGRCLFFGPQLILTMRKMMMQMMMAMMIMGMMMMTMK